MQNYALTHVGDEVLLRDLAAIVVRDRATTATLLACIAEVDARRLYVPAGYSSMHAYCVGELRLSEDAAKKRIQAARAARQFPAIFHAIAEGRLHLTGVCLLAPYLTTENARGLIESATHKRKTEIEELLARHFQLPDVRVRPTTPIHSELQLDVPSHSGGDPAHDDSALSQGAPEHIPKLQSAVLPTTAERFLMQLIIAKSTHDKLLHAQALLSHALPTGDVAQVLDRALDALIAQLEKRKLGVVTRRPRRSTAGNRPAPRGRYVPAPVRRAVWERDRGQCTFVSASGTRCTARRFLEFDHVDPVALGGQASVDRMRLRCRAHNQYEAERVFGARFMRRKRHDARLAAAEGSARPSKEHTEAVLAGLRVLGCKANEARRAVALSETIPGTTLEERMRLALKSLRPG